MGRISWKRIGTGHYTVSLDINGVSYSACAEHIDNQTWHATVEADGRSLANSGDLLAPTLRIAKGQALMVIAHDLKEARAAVGRNSMKQVKCNKCGHVAAYENFPKGRDFFQNQYISSCPAESCNNRQSPGDASMRMFGGERPFVFVDSEAIAVEDRDTAIAETLRRAEEAS